MTDTEARIRAYWDEDAASYDRTAGHYPQSPVEWAGWCGVLDRLLPPAPARVLDVGAGTGTLSITAARLGHEVTALDLSAGMLSRLREKAAAERLPVTPVHAAADAIPSGRWDAVVSRHLLWTLPNPGQCLRAWRAAAPTGRLVLLEGLWGRAAGPGERARRVGRHWARRLRGVSHDHHAEYDDELVAALPLSGGVPPERLVDLVLEAGWPTPRLTRLIDLEWVLARQLPWPDRLFGALPQFALWAG